jgi:hypothetical protein
VGTRGRAAPEVMGARGGGPQTPKADVYSWGALMVGGAGAAAGQALCLLGACVALQRLALQCPALGAAAGAHTPPAACRLPQVEMLFGYGGFDTAMETFRKYSEAMERSERGDAEAGAAPTDMRDVVAPLAARARSRELRQLLGWALAREAGERPSPAVLLQLLKGV